MAEDTQLNTEWDTELQELNLTPGELFHDIRSRLGYSQQDFADLLAVNRSHLSQIENDKVEPMAATFGKLVQVMYDNGYLLSQTTVLNARRMARRGEAIDGMDWHLKRFVDWYQQARPGQRHVAAGFMSAIISLFRMADEDARTRANNARQQATFGPPDWLHKD